MIEKKYITKTQIEPVSHNNFFLCMMIDVQQRIDRYSIREMTDLYFKVGCEIITEQRQIDL